jgi:hypothetical protein
MFKNQNLVVLKKSEGFFILARKYFIFMMAFSPHFLELKENMSQNRTTCFKKQALIKKNNANKTLKKSLLIFSSIATLHGKKSFILF